MNSDKIRNQVVAIWKDLLETEEVDQSLDFVASGGDSLLAIELLTRLDEQYSEAGVFEMDDLGWITIDGIVEFLTTATGGGRRS